MSNYATTVSSTRSQTQIGLYSALAATVFAVLGSFLTWVKTPFGNVSGISGDGIVILGLAAVAVGFIIWGLKAARMTRAMTLGLILPGFVQLAVGFIDYRNIGGDKLEGLAKPGIGLYIVIVAAIGLIAAGAYIALRGEGAQS